MPVVGHDWGARVAYTLAAVAPERVIAIVALALPYQPRGAFTIPPFEQARAFGHFPHREAPDEVAQTIDRHLDAAGR